MGTSLCIPLSVDHCASPDSYILVWSLVMTGTWGQGPASGAILGTWGRSTCAWLGYNFFVSTLLMRTVSEVTRTWPQEQPRL